VTFAVLADDPRVIHCLVVASTVGWQTGSAIPKKRRSCAMTLLPGLLKRLMMLFIQHG
jgi:hypothetical protein